MKDKSIQELINLYHSGKLTIVEKNFIKGLTKLVLQPQKRRNFVSSVMCPNKFVKCPCLETRV